MLRPQGCCIILSSLIILVSSLTDTELCNDNCNENLMKNSQCNCGFVCDTDPANQRASFQLLTNQGLWFKLLTNQNLGRDDQTIFSPIILVSYKLKLSWIELNICSNNNKLFLLTSTNAPPPCLLSGLICQWPVILFEIFGIILQFWVEGTGVFMKINVSQRVTSGYELWIGRPMSDCQMLSYDKNAQTIKILRSEQR